MTLRRAVVTSTAAGAGGFAIAQLLGSLGAPYEIVWLLTPAGSLPLWGESESWWILPLILLANIGIFLAFGSLAWLVLSAFAIGANERWMRLSLTAVVVALPLATLAVFYALIAYVRISTGYWPSRNHPDPGVMIPLDDGVAVLVLLTVFSPFIVPPALFLLRSQLRLSMTRPVAVFSGCWLVWVAFIWLDPGNFFFWFFD